MHQILRFLSTPLTNWRRSLGTSSKRKGSSIVRHLVLDRLMESEVSTAIGQEHRDSSIIPANYWFRVLGEEDLGVTIVSWSKHFRGERMSISSKGEYGSTALPSRSSKLPDIRQGTLLCGSRDRISSREYGKNKTLLVSR